MENKEFKTTLIEVDDARVSYCVSNNTVKIHINSKPDPYPIPDLVLDNIVTFEPNSIYNLLYSNFKDDMLCDRLTREIAKQEKLSASGNWPICIFIDVTLTPITFSGESDQMETCAICLEEATNLCDLGCSHVFHNDCIIEWLCEANTCPICRATIEDDDDHPYYYD